METIEDIVRAMRDFENLSEDGYDQYEAYRMLCWFADRIEKAAERERQYEYGLKDEGGFVSRYHSHTHHAAHVLKTKAETVVRREVGEWEPVPGGDGE